MEISILGNALLEFVELWVGNPTTNFLSFALLIITAIGIISWAWKYLICRKGG